MSYVIAIDVGIKNLGLCVFDFRTAKVVAWENVTLVSNGRYIPANNVQYVRDFVQRFSRYFESVFALIIERQIRCNMRIVEAVLQSMFFDKCIIISARSVKVHYDLSTKNYRANKQKAVEWAKRFVQNNPHAFIDDVAAGMLTRASKQDDLADSLLLIMYYLDTYSNHLTSTCTLHDLFDTGAGDVEFMG
jgi:hypothetical protein|tara:strand:- start:2059 stop:2628 length:570 start_codon:yes stop_codon:yes gene_type:complete